MVGRIHRDVEQWEYSGYLCTIWNNGAALHCWSWSMIEISTQTVFCGRETTFEGAKWQVMKHIKENYAPAANLIGWHDAPTVAL